MNTAPWVRSPSRSAQRTAGSQPGEVARVAASLTARGPVGPQASLVEPPRPGFPRRNIDGPRAPVSVWWLGVHGGAGETTLAQLLEGSWEAGHAWPQTAAQAQLPRVILVARTNARGLRAAQRAAIEWASGSVAVQLHGLVLIADAPGRLPRPLRDFAHVVAGGAPRVWHLPWVQAWRLGDPVCAETAPKAVTAVLADVRDSYVQASHPSPNP